MSVTRTDPDVTSLFELRGGVGDLSLLTHIFDGWLWLSLHYIRVGSFLVQRGARDRDLMPVLMWRGKKVLNTRYIHAVCSTMP